MTTLSSPGKALLPACTTGRDRWAHDLFRDGPTPTRQADRPTTRCEVVGSEVHTPIRQFGDAEPQLGIVRGVRGDWALQLLEFLRRKMCLREDAAQGTGRDLPMLGHDRGEHALRDHLDEFDMATVLRDFAKSRNSKLANIISRHSKQREDCFQKAVIKRGLRCMRRSALRARSFSSP